MAKFGSVIDYTDRTVDLLIYHGADPDAEVLLTRTLAEPGGGGKLCTGIQKLAQRFLVNLFQERGTIKYDEEAGTFFMSELRTGGIQTPADLLGAFARGTALAEDALVSEETDTMPDDERFDSVEVISVSLAGGRGSIRFRLTSAAGDSRVFIFPLPTTV